MFQSIKRAVIISRPIFWPSTFFAFIFGVIFSHNALTPLMYAYGFIWSFPYSLWICAVNDQADIDTDSQNSYRGGISGAKVSKNETKLLKKLIIVSLTIILLPILYTFNYLFWVTSLFALAIPYIYSAYPFRLKERPPLDSLSNGAFVTCVFISGYVFNEPKTFDLLFIQAALCLFLGVSAIHIIGALRDFTPDKLASIQTIAVLYGRRRSAFIAFLLFTFIYLCISGFPIEFHIFVFTAMLASLYLCYKPSELMSLRLGFGLIILFFIISSYSIIFGSWKMIL